MKTLLAVPLTICISGSVHADDIRSGAAAFGDWRGDAPAVTREITVGALPAPFASPSSSETPLVIARPAGASPHLPPGFGATVFASGLNQPRTMRTAPNGDIFVAESGGQIRVLRPADGVAKPMATTVFAAGLNVPFGIAFWPPGPSPRFVYIGETTQIVRYPYETGDLQARGPAQVIVPHLPVGGHWTRDIVFSADGSRMFVSVGSDGNLDEELTGEPPPDLPLGQPGAQPGAPTWVAPTCCSFRLTGVPSVSSPPACATAPPRRSSPAPVPCGAW
jgi:glucose/arabinose dehydrogenase